jgi:hypothetical protein
LATGAEYNRVRDENDLDFREIDLDVVTIIVMKVELTNNKGPKCLEAARNI